MFAKLNYTYIDAWIIPNFDKELITEIYSDDHFYSSWFNAIIDF